MRRRLLLPLLFIMACVVGKAETVEFTAASLNVDGMPPSLLNGMVKLNPDAQEGPGATNIGNGIKRFVWDFVALSEDFNYHSELMAPISQYYYAGTHRGKLYNKIDVLTSPFKTDGLGFLWKKDYDMKTELWWGWNQKNGKTKDGSDELIDKGFRYYLIELAPGLEVDVYIHHMDAETGEKDNAARKSQLEQLRDHILKWSGNRPIIIMGDTNCRWTRDPLQTVFFDPINADPRFDIHDPWVEFMWAEEGGYDAPQIQQGASSIMTHTFGSQKGEVVDKIFYINNKDSEVKLTALSYRSEVTFTFSGEEGGVPLADHFPVVVKFRAEMPTVRTGTEYFLRNKATGQFMNQGGAWGTQAVLYPYGNRIKLENAANGDYYLKTTAGYMKSALYVDGAENERGTFKLIEAGPNNKYVKISTDGLYCKAPTSSNYKISLVGEGDSNNDYCLWELVTIAQLYDELLDATESHPIDATHVIKAANFNRADTDNTSAWAQNQGNKLTTLNVGGDGILSGDEYSDANKVNANNFVTEFYNSGHTSTTYNTSAGTLKQSISGLPNGKYKVSFQGFTRNGNENFYVSFNGNQVRPDDISAYGQSSQIHSNATQSGGKWVPNGMSSAAAFFNLGYYTKEQELVITNNSLEIVVNKPNTTSSTWMCLDNFRLTYYGPTPEMQAGRNRVKEALDDVASILPRLDDRGRGNYNNSLVEQAYAKNRISTSGETEVKETYAALAAATKVQSTPGADMSYAIDNWSFEMGWMEWDRNHPFWISKWTSDTFVVENSNPTFTTQNVHGEYLFNTWGGGNSVNAPVSQDVTGLPEGVYTLSAWVSSDAGNRAYVHANGVASTENAITKGGGELVKVSMEVIVEDGQTLCLGAGAVAANATPVVPKSSAEEVWDDPNANNQNYNSAWYRCDNFGLTYVCNLSFRLLQKAIDDATAKAKSAGVSVDLSKWQQMVNNRTVSEDAKTEIVEVYQALGQAVLKSKNTDKTYAIVNNSFELAEWGLNILGWNLLADAGDTAAKPNSDATYTMNGCDGNYVFNTWQDGRGTVISQTIPNVPSGHYKLSATVANDENRYVYFEVKGDANVTGQKSPAIQVAGDLKNGVTKEFEFDVAANTPEITIYFGGCNSDGSYDDFGGDWYKVDNFRLVRTGEANTCTFYKRLLAAIEDANEVVAETLPEKYSEQWDVTDYEDIIKRHLDSDHSQENLIGSGLDEVNDVYDRLRTLIFSQTETEANMTGAIKNHSFELGDLTGWTCPADPNTDAKVTIGNQGGTYGTAGIDDEYLFNCFNNGDGYAIYQTIPCMASGHYRLSALVASYVGNKFYLAANGQPSELITVDKPEGEFTRYYVDFVVEEDCTDVIIGLYPTSGGNFAETDSRISNGWYKVDDFQLELLGRDITITWTMETPTHGTIMLPFSVSAEKLKKEQLEVYALTGSEPSATPADPEVNTYHILTFEKRDYIAANRPYVVKNVAPAAVASRAKGRRVATYEQGNPTYKFSGFTTNKQDTIAREIENNVDDIDGMFVGTLVSHETQPYEHHLNIDGDNDNVGFVHHELALDDNTVYEAHDSIPAYHAYLINPVQANDTTAENLVVTEFYFYEPTLPIEWTMEGELYGTLILPFDAEIPAEFGANGLGVYPVNGLSEVKTYQDNEKYPGHHFDYQILETGDEASYIIANTPYLVMVKDARNAAARKAPNKAPADAYEGLTQTFSGAATNKEASYGDEYTGVLTTTDIDDAARTLKSDGSFVAGDSEQVGAYHAYLPTAQSNYVYVTGPNEDQVSGIEDLIAADGEVDVYDLSGVLLRTEVPVSEALEGLGEGIYILRSGELSVKVLK